MNYKEQINLKKLIDESNWQDNTSHIRKYKNSEIINKDLKTMIQLKIDHSKMRINEPNKFASLCISQCSNLYNNFNDIYHKAFKDELNLNLMKQLLDVLARIEDKEIDQQQVSIQVGQLLKEIYIDSALKQKDNLEKKNKSEEKIYLEGKNISWKDYKNNSII